MICFELQRSEALPTAHTTMFPYTIDGVPFWMRYYTWPLTSEMSFFLRSVEPRYSALNILLSTAMGAESLPTARLRSVFSSRENVRNQLTLDNVLSENST